jgi:hypothetical protein
MPTVNIRSPNVSGNAPKECAPPEILRYYGFALLGVNSLNCTSLQGPVWWDRAFVFVTILPGDR